MQSNLRSHGFHGVLGPLLALVFFQIPIIAGAADLGSARLDVVGTRLTVSPEAQTVPYRTATIVETELAGFDMAQGRLPATLRVVGDFTGPEIDGILRLETTPGEPFRIPRLSVEGQYQLDDIRLVQGDELLTYAHPRSAGVLVTQVLVTRVTSRALTLDEIRNYGLVIDDENFHAFNFTFGFAVDGEVFDYNVPVIASPGGNGGVTLQMLEGVDPLRGGGRWGTTTARFKPPQLAPFTLELERSARGLQPAGGCLAVDGCSQGAPVSLPGVILFPTDVSLLNQFFSVVVIAKNDAPAGDALVIRDLTAKISLPPGLRQAETEPPTALGVPVPVRVPGPDGELGTGDDITFLVAQSEGQAEVLVEGRRQGTHVVEFDLHGVLDGFPDGEIRKVTGTARGAVVVRDPTLGLTISHPDTVRTDEEYSLFLTLSNTGNAPVNLLSLTLPTQQLSGVEVIGSNTQSIPTLVPGESEVVEFRLRSLRTGRVVASTIKMGSQVTPAFELAVGVGDAGIPLSPDSIVLPRAAELLPSGLAREALGMTGLGYSLATAPPSALRPELPWIELDRLHERVYWLSQAGRHVDLGEELFDSVAVLAAEWTGARDADWEWDLLRRTTGRGAGFGTEVGLVLAAEASATSPDLAFERFVATTAFLRPLEGALATGDGVALSVASRTSGKTVSGPGSDPQRSRGLPFAELYDLGGSQMALVAVPEDGGYRVQVTDSNGGSSSLRLLVPEADGTLRTVEWNGVSLSSAGSASVDYRADDTSFTLQVDSDGDGLAESQLTGSLSTVAPRAFAVVAAAQDPVTVTGHTVEVLFTQDVDLRSLLDRDPSHFALPGKVSNGGLVEAERDVASFFELVAENPFEGLMNTRVVRVSFDNALSPYKTHDMAVNGVESVTGELVTGDVVTVETRVTDPGTIVQGTVYGPDGQPVPFAKIELLEVDFFYFKIFSDPCERHRTALVEADAQGRFEFDYVRQTQCGDLFRIRGFDPLSGHHGTSQGRVRFIGQPVQLDILMLGRGTVRGRVTYEDGTVPEKLQVVGYSPVFSEGREAELGPDGTYEIRDLPVGTVSLGASDRIGSFVYQTVEIPRAGAVTERDLVIFRRPSEEPTGDVRGTVIASDSATPLFDAYISLYVDGELVGVERSGFDGSFDFGTVRAGVAEIEAFDGDTGRSGAQVFFEVEPDQVNDVTVLLQDDQGTVEGYVYRQTLSQTTPLAGAVVWVSGTPFNTMTDENGYYRLEGVYAGTRSVLAADLERQVQVSAQVTVSSAGQTVFRDLYFVESVGSGLAGEVLGFTGNPVAGATIHLADGHGGWWKEVTTDLNGRFTIPDLKPGGYEIHAIKGSLGAVANATIRFEGETPFVTIRFQRGTIRGSTQVINESGQLTGVTSLVTYRTTVPNDFGLVQLDLEAHTLETAADGTFEIPEVLAGQYVVTASNALHGEKTFRDKIVFDGEVRQHDVVFRESGTVSGVVLDWDGETPVAGALVNLRHPAFSAYDLTTDEEGRFSFELVPPRSRRFAIDAEIEQDGIFRTARIWVGLTRSGQELDTEIVLPMQGTVSGWVEDSNGAPVPGAVVTLREASYPNRTLVHNADSEGNFSFTNIFVGDVSLTAQAPALGGLGGRDSVEIIEEQQEVFSLIVLEATGEIEGAIFSPETGEEVSTAQVTLQRWPSSRTFDSVTASEGEFRFRLLPLDMYRVRVFDPETGRFGQSGWFLLETNGQVLRIDVTLQVRGDVDGHLTEPSSGLGVPGATIRLYSKSLRPFTTYSSTDVDGYFEFLGIPEGTFTLSTKEPGGRRLASGSGEILEEDQRVTVDLTLEEYGRVVGSVLNPPGLPAGLFANSNVVLYENGRVIGASLDNPFTFDGVLSGRSLEVRAYENGGDRRANVKGKLQTGESEITLDLQMVARGSLAVTVLDSGGAPVAGASVWGRNKGYYGSKYLTASTGPDGRVVFTDIGAGWISVSAGHPTSVLKGSAHGDLTLEGEQVELVVQLEPSGVVRGRALLSDGITPAEEGLAVVTRGGRTLQVLMDANGDFEFVGVPLGSYSLFVQESFGPGIIKRSGSLSTDGEVVDLGTLVLDDHDPAVLSITPATGSADLPLSTVATVRFSEPVDVSKWSGSWITFRKVGGGNVGFTPSWSEGDTLLTLTPNSPLASFTAYDLIVNNAHDLAGRQLSVKGRTTFNTVDVVPPAVVDFLPREGDNQIPLDASILVTFSEPVAFGSLSGSALQLTDLTTGTGVTTTFQHLTGERQVLVTPASGLQANREYQLTVQNVRDNGGNAMTAPATLTFWSVDLAPPEITSVVFPQGTSYAAGDEVPVQVTVTDEWGVASTELVIEGWTWSDDTEPWELTGVAPITAAAGQITVEIRATDVHGNVGTTTRTLDVAPNTNAVDPAPAVACGRDGGWVVPGYAVELGAVATDDETVESIALLVDGVEIDRAAPLATSPAEASFLWTPPAGAATGTTWTVRLEARDFAGNVGATEITLTTPPTSATVVTSGTTLFPTTYDGTDLVLVSGTFQYVQPLDLASLTVLRSARVVTQVGQALPIDLTASGVFDLQCGGQVDASEDGYFWGSGPDDAVPAGVTPPVNKAGGSHGGQGAPGYNEGSISGATFDSLYQPTLGGGAGSQGGTGGGVVRVEAGSVELDGEILARGASGTANNSGGAGGSVWIATSTLAGSGRIDASGADSLSSSFVNGSGGGGRIAIQADQVATSFDPVAQLLAWGGSRSIVGSGTVEVLDYGGPGTVLIETLAEPNGSLFLANGQEADGTDRAGRTARLPGLGQGAILAFDVAGADAWVTASGPFRPRWVGAWMALADSAGGEVGTFRVDSLDAQGRALLRGAGAVTSATAFAGEWRFDRVEVARSAVLEAEEHLRVGSLTVEGGLIPTEVTASEAAFGSSAIVTPLRDGSIRLRVAGAMTVASGAVIDVSGLGYAGGCCAAGVQAGETVPGLVASSNDAGGSHGGGGTVGYYASGVAGGVFDSVYDPVLGGGGGGSHDGSLASGGAGGGVLSIEAGSLLLEGSLLANGWGTTLERGGAGAGGTVSITTGLLSGAGSIEARGGDTVYNTIEPSGAGGGGRVSLVAHDLSGFDVTSQVRAWGGSRIQSADATYRDYGTAGTVYLRDAGSTYGRLVVDNGVASDGADREGAPTELPSLEDGSISSLTPSGVDAWLSAPEAFRERWAGVWVVLLDSAGAELGSFRAAELDASGRLLLEGAGAVTGAATYRGEYRFDRIDILHGGGLETTDPLAGSTVVVGAGLSEIAAEIVAQEVLVKAGAVVRPASGGSLGFEVSGTMTVEGGAVIDVSGHGYGGGCCASGPVAGATAPGVAPSSGDAGGSHGGHGVIGQRVSSSVVGDVHDSVYSPVLAGGGGGSDDGDSIPGGAGGGVLRIEAGSLILDGALLANGDSTTGSVSGGGAGGTVKITATSLAGSGSIEAIGGDSRLSGEYVPGAGGGGRVALLVDDLSGFDASSQVAAWGGERYQTSGPIVRGHGAAGTIYLRDSVSTYGRLFLNNGVASDGTARQGPPTELPALGTGPVLSFDVMGADAWLTGGEAFRDRWAGVWVVLLDAGGAELGAFRVGDLDAGGRLLLEGAGSVTGTASYRGEYRFDEIETVNGGGVESSDPLTGSTVVFEGESDVAAEITAQDVLVKAGAVVRPGSGGSLRMTVSGTLTVEAGALIDVSELGYGGGCCSDGPQSGETVAGLTGSFDDAGGSHGGAGTLGFYTSTGVVGEVFDSVYAPVLGGGGGGSHDGDSGPGAAGGGVLRIEAGTVVLDGALRANGQTVVGSQRPPGGAGGTVAITAGSLSGGGSIEALGGDSLFNGTTPGGAGGGGRVSLVVGDLSGFDVASQARAWGGTRFDTSSNVDRGYAAPGTVHAREASETYGRLILDNGVASDGTDRQGPPTELPALGTGSVASFDVSGTDAWLSGASPFLQRWAGVWVVLLDAGGSELGAFRVADLDPAGRLLLEGAGAVTDPESYRGEYRFDTIEISHGAGVESAAPLHGSTVVFEPGEIETTDRLTAGDLRIKTGAVVRPVSGDSLRMTVSGTLTLEAGATIDLSELGYLGGRPPGSSTAPGGAPAGLTASTYDVGGSHGGRGSWGYYGTGTLGEVFDSVYAPSLGGGGGAISSGNGGSERGGDGGGVLEIEAGAVVLEGELLARGESRTDKGAGGAGGAVRIVTGSLSGAGTIDVSGGSTDYWNIPVSGGGGGGRVAIEADALSGFDPQTQVEAQGGESVNDNGLLGYAAAGTLYVKTAGDTYGRLWVDSGVASDGSDRRGPATELPSLGTGSVASLDTSGADAWLTGEDPFRERWVGVWVVVLDADGTELGAFRGAERDPSGRLLLEEAGSVVGATGYRGEYRFDRIDTRHGAGIAASDPVTSSTMIFEAGETETAADLQAADVLVKAGAVVRPGSGGSLRMTVSGTLTVEAGALIDVSELGYGGGCCSDGPQSGETVAGLTGSFDDAGGSHGGAGTLGFYTSTGVVGEVFDSVYAPVLGGGGGGSHDGDSGPGAAGGGVLRIEAGTVVLDGALRANGQTVVGSQRPPGGAGGTVAITAGSLSGGGSIEALGGDSVFYGTTPGGSGGGGRVSLVVGDLSGFDVASQARAWGGTRFDTSSNVDRGYAAPGTVFRRTSLSTFGDLRIDQGGGAGLAIPATALPSIGKGTIGTVTAFGADLWIEDADPAKLFSLGATGMWVRVAGVDYPVIGDSPDRRQLLLEDAAGLVVTGDTYVGVYKFDSLTVTGDAHLILRDEDDTGSYQVDPGSTYTEYDLDPPAVAVTSPAAGTLFAAGDPVSIAADVTDLSGVVSVTFRLGEQSFVDTEAPYEWTTAAPVVTVEEDIDIEIESVDGEANVGLVLHTIRVRPLAQGDPPVVSIGCPSPGARLAPGTGLDFAVTATHDDGVERVELFVDGSATPVATAFSAPYDFRIDLPAGALDGDVVTLTFRARSFGGVEGEITYPVQVVAANVVTADTFVSSVDTSFDGSSVVVAAGTLTLEGAHTFRDLVVLDGAAVTHPAATVAGEERLEVNLTRDLFVACGGTIDATAQGYPGGESYGEGLTTGALLLDDFDDGTMDGWQVVDGGTGGGPSNWYVNSGVLYQGSDIHDPNGDARGTFAHWTGAPLALGNYRLGFRMKSNDDDLVGTMFRIQDQDNYYRFNWYRQSSVRYLEKRVGGVRYRLAEDNVKYIVGRWYDVEVVVDGTWIEVWVDGERIFAVEDDSFSDGTVGFYTGANTGGFFDDVRVAEISSRSISTGGSHGGRGGGNAATSTISGSLFNPRDAGAGGGSRLGAAGGGVVGIGVAGAAVVDGVIRATGGIDADHPAGAGGSVRLDAASISGLGSIDASGGGDPASARPAGGGGRIALYGANVDDGLVDRSLATGGNATTPELRGAAGTIFVKEDAQTFGELIVDAGGVASDHPTELLGFPPGVLSSVGVSTMADDQADFLHDLTGMDVYFEGDTSVLWTIAGHDNHGQTLTLDTSVEPLTALAGDTYAGLYRFDRVVVRGGANTVTGAGIQSVSDPEVEAGSSSAEEYVPSVTVTAPIHGQDFNSGSTVTITAQIDDLFGMTTLDLSMGSQAVRVTEAPYSASFVAPIVSASTDFAVTAVMTDRAGYESTDSLTIRIDPLSDGAAPVVSLDPCPGDGDAAIPSSTISVGFTAIDNTQIHSWRVLVNGVVEYEVTEVAQTSVTASYVWTVPAGAAPGSAYALRVEAQDYGGDVGAATRTVTVPTGPTLTGSQSIDSTWNGTDLTLTAGTFTVTEPLSLQSLVLADGAVVTPQAGTDLSLDVTGELRVQCGTFLDASSLGYLGGVYNAQVGGAPSWVTGSSPDAGGSHGGAGSLGYDGPGPAGDVFDSVYRPRLGGGGGALDYNNSSRWGGSGGGVIDLTVGTLVLDGEIRAQGETRRYDLREAGGAGGTVRVVAGQIQGTGRIDVSGGNEAHCGSGEKVGAGGGGRVAIEGSLVGFDVATQVSAHAGHLFSCNSTLAGYAAPGTVWVAEPGAVHGDLRIDAGIESDGTERIGPATELPSLGAGTVTSVEVASTDLWVTSSSPLTPRWDGAWMVLVDGSGSDLGSFEVLSMDGTGRALLAGAGGIATAASFRGEYRFDSVTLSNGAGLAASDRLEIGAMTAEGASRLPAVMEVTGDLTIAASSAVTPSDGGTLTLDVGGTLYVQAGAVLDVSALGYEGGNTDQESGQSPPNVAPSDLDAGGSHGGAGWTGYHQFYNPGTTKLPGEVYDSVYFPSYPGGGGGRHTSTQHGGSGGGVITVDAASVVLDGELRARGQDRNGDYAGAGAGGTIVVRAGSLIGTGSIDASGGDYPKADSTWGPGGGGGRVALLVDDLSAWDAVAQVAAWAGKRWHTSTGEVQRVSAHGTIYLLSQTSTYGDLVVVQDVDDGKTGGETVLPTPGTGTVGTTTVDASDPDDLWVEPQDPAALFDLGVTGMWLRIGGSDYRVLDQSADRRTVLLDGAAGLVSVGETFAGVYKFDTVTVRGGAILEFLDTAEATTFDVDADSQVITPQ